MVVLELDHPPPNLVPALQRQRNCFCSPPFSSPPDAKFFLRTDLVDVHVFCAAAVQSCPPPLSPFRALSFDVELSRSSSENRPHSWFRASPRPLPRGLSPHMRGYTPGSCFRAMTEVPKIIVTPAFSFWPSGLTRGSCSPYPSTLLMIVSDYGFWRRISPYFSFFWGIFVSVWPELL